MKLKILTLILFTFFMSGCEGGKMKGDLSYLNDIPQKKWDELSSKKIFFGHQSVGYNIIDGIQDIMQEMPNIKLNITETNQVKNFNRGIFAHSTIGENCDLKSKLHDFKALLDKGLGRRIDIAFVKFCYVDIDKNADLKELFKNYTETFSNLKKQYPRVTFIHFTIPLQQANPGWKVLLKKLLRKPLIGEGKNIKRNVFNQMLLDKYSKEALVFDLAEYESTYPGGKRQFFKADGKRYFSLVPEYTDDGGHLNKNGREKIGGKLLEFLAANTSVDN